MYSESQSHLAEVRESDGGQARRGYAKSHEFRRRFREDIQGLLMRYITLAIIPVLWAGLSLGGYAQNLITNGGFEAPVSGGAFSPAGWTLGGTGSATGATYAAYESIGAFNRPGTVGNQFAVFNDGGVSTGGTISQTFTAVANEQYDLFFLFGNANFTGSPVAQSIAVDIFDASNVLLTTIAFSDTNGNDQDLTSILAQRTTSFFSGATGGTYTLTFRDTSAGPVGSDGFLDNIFLRRTAPELNTRAALPFALISLVAICAVNRRRKPELAEGQST